MRVCRWWPALCVTLLVSLCVLVAPSQAGLGSARSAYIVSSDCAGLANQPGLPLCVQEIGGELVSFVFGEGGLYIRPSEGVAGTTPTLTQVCADATSCTNTAADTIPLAAASSADPDLRCELSVVSSVPGLRCFDASNVQLTTDDAVFSGQTKSTTIDNGVGTQTSCIDVDDTGLTDYSANESCGAHTNTRYVGFREHDSPPACAAGDYYLYADLSETSVKVCNNGSAAVIPGVGGAGDIEGVTAGTGLSGGGTTGTVTLDLALTELGAAVTVGDGTQATQTWTWDGSGTDTSIAFGNALFTATGNFDATGRIQGNKVRIDGTTCLDVTGDRIWHDTNCDVIKDAGEEFIDQAYVAADDTFLFQLCFAGDDTTTQTLFLKEGCGEVVSAGTTTDTTSTATRFGPTKVYTLRNMRCASDVNIPGATTFTQTLRVEGVDESMTCPITTGTATCEDLTNTELTAAGNMISLKSVDSTANDSGVRIRCTIEVHK